MEILCSFRLALERITGKEIPESSRLEFLEKFLANNFALPAAEDNTYGLLNRGGKRWSLFFSSTCKFGIFKNPFATIASLFELYFGFRIFILVDTNKKLISMT